MSTTLITDIIQDIINQVDTTALDITIQSYLENPENGFMDSTATSTYYNDGTAYVPIDATSFEWITNEGYTDGQEYILPPTLTVEQWKALYLEETIAAAYRSIDKPILSDSNGPHYPIVDWSVLEDFDTTSSVDFAIAPDTTSDIYLQIEYPDNRWTDSVYIQGGIAGVQNYPSYTNYNMMAFYIGFSDNGVDWNYICQLDTQTYLEKLVDGTSVNFYQQIVETSLQSTAIANPLWYMEEFPLTGEEIVHLVRFQSRVQGKYWRIYMIDLESFLTYMGEESGYTGYTASLSHLKLEGKREEAKTAVINSINSASIDPKLFTTGILYETEASHSTGTIVDNTFTFANDDGYSGFSGLMTAVCSGNTIGTYTFYLDVTTPDGSLGGWQNLGQIAFTNPAQGTLVAAFSEVPRLTGDVARRFRIRASHSAGSPTVTAEGGAFIAYFGGWNTFSNWPNPD